MAETTAAPRIAFLIQGHDAPSTRIRILNLLPHFQAANLQTHVEVYPNSIRDWRRVLAGVRGADILFIQKRLPSLLEALFLKRLAKRIVFDFDDSVWLRNRQGDARPSRKLQRRFKHFLKRVDLAICGNPILEDYLRRQCPMVASVVIPSSVPAPEPPSERKANVPLRVGWVGTEINLPYLVAIEPALIAAHSSVPFELTVICSAPPRFERFPHVRFVPWSDRTEYEHIRQFDAGIMPLADNEHSRGKCAYKALQYMSGGVPVIASDVGINREWIEKPGAGVVVSPDGWTDALVKILSSDSLRVQMGTCGIEAIRTGFRHEDAAAQYLRAFRRLLAQA